MRRHAKNNTKSSAKPKTKPNMSTIKKPMPKSTTSANTSPTVSTTTNIGSAFDDLLKEEGTYAATKGRAIKRVRTWQMKAPPRKS